MTDNFGGGVLAGEAIIEALNKKGGEVLILSYDDAQSCLLRVEGFKKKIGEWNAANPNAEINICRGIAWQSRAERQQTGGRRCSECPPKS